ncbi:MAG: DUF3710 domain-containing protein [Rhodoluna sp.]
MIESYQSEKSAPADRASAGPFDSAEVVFNSPYLDLGAIKLPTKDDLQVRLEVEEANQRVVAVTLEYDESSLQLQAFSAPKSEGLWHTIRQQLSDSVELQGGVVEARVGSLGPELLAKLPINDAAGKPVGTRFTRFVGVDGPKWFLRGVISGAAITDPKAAAEIDDLFRSVTVHRDAYPLPPGDLLTLQVPGGTITPPKAM